MISVVANYAREWTAVERRTEFVDPRSIPAAATGAILLLLALVSFAATNFTLIPTRIYPGLLLYAWLMLGGAMSRKYGMLRVSAWLTSIATLTVVSAAALMLMVVATAWAAPFQDSVLIEADRAMGFKWLDLYNLFMANPVMFDINSALYRLIVPLPYVMMTVLAFSGDYRRLWVLMLAWGVCLAFTIAIYPLFPAVGPYEYFHIDQTTAPKALSAYPWLFDEKIAAIRDHGQRVVDPKDFIGLVSLPSFHMASAVLLAWAALTIRWIGKPTAALSLGMGLAAAISGSHYLIDLIAGAGLSILSLWIAMRLTPVKTETPRRRHGSFSCY